MLGRLEKQKMKVKQMNSSPCIRGGKTFGGWKKKKSLKVEVKLGESLLLSIIYSRTGHHY